jgi:predicted metal-binding membrane protein
LLRPSLGRYERDAQRPLRAVLLARRARVVTSLITGRFITVSALVAVTIVSWALLAKSAAVMSAMAGERLFLDLANAMMQPLATGPYLGASAVMWAVMMVAMMAPALSPSCWCFRSSTAAFAGAPVQLESMLFADRLSLRVDRIGLAATVVQWSLHRAALLDTHVMSAAPQLAGCILVTAGCISSRR